MDFFAKAAEYSLQTFFSFGTVPGFAETAPLLLAAASLWRADSVCWVAPLTAGQWPGSACQAGATWKKIDKKSAVCLKLEFSAEALIFALAGASSQMTQLSLVLGWDWSIITPQKGTQYIWSWHFKWALLNVCTSNLEALSWRDNKSVLLFNNISKDHRTPSWHLQLSKPCLSLLSYRKGAVSSGLFLGYGNKPVGRRTHPTAPSGTSFLILGSYFNDISPDYKSKYPNPLTNWTWSDGKFSFHSTALYTPVNAQNLLQSTTSFKVSLVVIKHVGVNL